MIRKKNLAIRTVQQKRAGKQLQQGTALDGEPETSNGPSTNPLGTYASFDNAQLSFGPSSSVGMQQAQQSHASVPIDTSMTDAMDCIDQLSPSQHPFDLAMIAFSNEPAVLKKHSHKRNIANTSLEDTNNPAGKKLSLPNGNSPKSSGFQTQPAGAAIRGVSRSNSGQGQGRVTISGDSSGSRSAVDPLTGLVRSGSRDQQDTTLGASLRPSSALNRSTSNGTSSSSTLIRATSFTSTSGVLNRLLRTANKAPTGGTDEEALKAYLPQSVVLALSQQLRSLSWPPVETGAFATLFCSLTEYTSWETSLQRGDLLLLSADPGNTFAAGLPNPLEWSHMSQLAFAIYRVVVVSATHYSAQYVEVFYVPPGITCAWPLIVPAIPLPSQSYPSRMSTALHFS